VRAELTDRVGLPPEPVDALLRLQAVRIKAQDLDAGAVVVRGGRLQVEGLVLDDDQAQRVRSQNARAVYFKQRQTLSVHAAAGDPPPAAWAEAVLDGIIAARVGNPVTP
jgi:hypothetical protein